MPNFESDRNYVPDEYLRDGLNESKGVHSGPPRAKTSGESGYLEMLRNEDTKTESPLVLLSTRTEAASKAEVNLKAAVLFFKPDQNSILEILPKTDGPAEIWDKNMGGPIGYTFNENYDLSNLRSPELYQ